MTTKDSSGNVLGKTEYVCDGCVCVPKYDVFDSNGEKKYRIRPDVCCLGACVLCRIGGNNGKCFRVPYIIRDPKTYEPLKGNGGEEDAQLTQLWAGLGNAFCTMREAFHVVFPDGATTEEKLVLTGSTILFDVVQVENRDNDS